MNSYLVRKLPYNHPNRYDGTQFGGKRLWTPKNMSTNLWLDAYDESTFTKSGTSISQWSDKSGGGRHATQGTAANQPQFTANTLNGYPVVRFDGSSDFFECSGLGSSITNLSLVSVIKRDVNKQDTVIDTDGAFGSTTLHWMNESTTHLYSTQSLEVAGSTAWTTAWVISGFVDASTALTLYYNGSSDGTGGASSTKNWSSVNIGSWYNGSTVSRYFDGDMAEIVVVESALSDATRQKLEGYMAWKWGLQANLPGGHPYLSAPPVI